MATSSKMSLKLLIDTNRNRVVFAEAGKDFVDFLFGLLALPVGQVIRLLRSATMDGCIANIYTSLEQLNQDYMKTEQNKDPLPNPVIATAITNVPFLMPDPTPNQRKFYICEDCDRCITDLENTTCCDCCIPMSRQVQFVSANDSASTSSSTRDQGGGGYVKGLITYMVTDDLSVSPMSMISCVGLINQLDVTDFHALKEKVVEFGADVAVELLKASLQSKATLSHVFLGAKQGKEDIDFKAC